MANTIHKFLGTGGSGGVVKHGVVTLSSGQATFNHGFQKIKVISCVAHHATAIPAEGLGILGAPDANGWISSTNGANTVDSSNASSTIQVSVTVLGYSG